MNYSAPTKSPNVQNQRKHKTTLVVKHIPPSLTGSPEKQCEFFMKYGASRVRPMESKRMKGMAFLDFEDSETAQLAYQQLDKRYVESARKGLCVEYAVHDPTQPQSNTNDSKQQRPSTPPRSKILPFTTPNTSSLGSTADTTTLSTPVPVAAELGLQYASNPHLLYRYPNPTPDILNNMMNAIGTIPRLYTQVLHLMNKMNLPPPFDPAPSTQMSTPSLLKRKKDDMLASDESEIEPDDEADEQEQILQLRRTTAQQKRKHLKKV
ncbi:hypothetical protein BCR42DRAFT_416515 [Absidia repens]|uniref:RRM domain-containing protein n=1 Tax=Absidia repens TaxID=90262 RepID=A0A1X2IEM0_9FUNG|nr:hypothetical protein BCR42DRAFT_416515 [Absidia repens]